MKKIKKSTTRKRGYYVRDIVDNNGEPLKEPYHRIAQRIMAKHPSYSRIHSCLKSDDDTIKLQHAFRWDNDNGFWKLVIEGGSPSLKKLKYDGTDKEGDKKKNKPQFEATPTEYALYDESEDINKPLEPATIPPSDAYIQWHCDKYGCNPPEPPALVTNHTSFGSTATATPTGWTLTQGFFNSLH